MKWVMWGNTDTWQSGRIEIGIEPGSQDVGADVLMISFTTLSNTGLTLQDIVPIRRTIFQGV